MITKFLGFIVRLMYAIPFIVSLVGIILCSPIIIVEKIRESQQEDIF